MPAQPSPVGVLQRWPIFGLWLTNYYMFQSHDHIQAIFKGEIGRNLFQKVAEKAGYLPLGAWYNGTRQLTLRTTKPIRIKNVACT